MLVNLYNEMTAVFKPYKITDRAIYFVTSAAGFMTIAEYIDFAKACTYENEDGLIHVDPSLKVVGRSFWLSREVVGGKETWVMHKHPVKPTLQIGDIKDLYSTAGFARRKEK